MKTQSNESSLYFVIIYIFLCHLYVPCLIQQCFVFFNTDNKLILIKGATIIFFISVIDLLITQSLLVCRISTHTFETSNALFCRQWSLYLPHMIY